jgi:hypothetical protein
MPSGSVDLSQCSVLHIKGFASRGHPPKNKYLVVIGRCSESEVIGFLMSTQLHYLKRDTHKKEVISVPDRSTSFLSSESIIQCFQLERLAISVLCDEFDQGRVSNAGKLPVKYAHKIRDVVRDSRLLPSKRHRGRPEAPALGNSPKVNFRPVTLLPA